MRVLKLYFLNITELNSSEKRNLQENCQENLDI